MSKTDYFRVFLVTATFALVGWKSPEYVKWAMLGTALICIVISMEHLTDNLTNNTKEER